MQKNKKVEIAEEWKGLNCKRQQSHQEDDGWKLNQLTIHITKCYMWIIHYQVYKLLHEEKKNNWYDLDFQMLLG